MSNIFDPNHQANSMPAKILFAVERLGDVLAGQLWNIAKTRKLTPLQIKILLFLDGHNDERFCNVSALAKEFQLAKPTISETIRLLHDKGLIQKFKDPNDGRAYNIRLTNEGKQEAAVAATFSTQVSQSIEKLGKSSHDELYINLLLALKQLQLDGLVPPQRMCWNCKHFNDDHDVGFCSLLKVKLPAPALRIDCPEFSLPT